MVINNSDDVMIKQVRIYARRQSDVEEPVEYAMCLPTKITSKNGHHDLFVIIGESMDSYPTGNPNLFVIKKSL